jgi:hypothetical protein
MNTPYPLTLPTKVQTAIRRLRGKIRRYVWIEGLALAFTWLVLSFWIGLALDYLPVLAGSSEMPKGARAVLLGGIVAVLGYVLYRWIWRRAFVLLRGSSLALLIERHDPGFHESLVTAVEVAAARKIDPQVDPRLLEQSVRAAADRLHDDHLSRVFDYGPLRRACVAALVSAMSLGLFAIVSRDSMATWVRRLYFLSDQPWPRNTRIEVMGFDQQRKILVAEGSDVTVRVRADQSRVVPERCTIVFRTAGGERGRVNMSKDGEPRDGFQSYLFSNAPFKGMLESVTFDVIGYDHRLRDFEVVVVPSPVVVDVRVKYQPPAYTGLLARDENWTAGMRCPLGSSIDIVATANKPLREIELTDRVTNVTHTLEPEAMRSRFQWRIDDLREPFAANVTLIDRDGIRSQQPFRITVGVMPDQVPKVNIELSGIGDAVTPDVRLPVVGTVQDDYGIDSAWFEVRVGDAEERRFPIETMTAERLDAVLDMREQRRDESNALSLTPGQELTLLVQARDRFDVLGQPNVGGSDSFSLRVVEANELLALLQARELGLRRRFEQIIGEMTETRDSLLRVKLTGPPPADENEKAADESHSGDDNALPPAGDAEGDAEAATTDYDQSLRVLRVQRAHQQGEKSSQETAGVSVAFQTIRAELVNNRVDSEERRERLEYQIVEPLNDIVGRLFPDWFDSINRLEMAVQHGQDSTSSVDDAVRKTDDILLAMETVLQKMEELESYNELVDLVRSILKQQEELLEKTKQERKAQAKSLLE